jgi:hypothetical protein
MKKKLAYAVLIAIAALFPALGACYERAVAETAQTGVVAP